LVLAIVVRKLSKDIPWVRIQQGETNKKEKNKEKRTKERKEKKEKYIQ
jgi:hypothetical protein